MIFERYRYGVLTRCVFERNKEANKLWEKKKTRGRYVSRDEKMHLSVRYYDIDGTGVSCGNARYYVLL